MLSLSMCVRACVCVRGTSLGVDMENQVHGSESRRTLVKGAEGSF